MSTDHEGYSSRLYTFLAVIICSNDSMVSVNRANSSTERCRLNRVNYHSTLIAVLSVFEPHQIAISHVRPFTVVDVLQNKIVYRFRYQRLLIYLLFIYIV